MRKWPDKFWQPSCHGIWNSHDNAYSFLNIILLLMHDISKMTGKIIFLFLSWIPLLYSTPSIRSPLLLSQTFYFSILSVFLSPFLFVLHVKTFFLPLSFIPLSLPYPYSFPPLFLITSLISLFVHPIFILLLFGFSLAVPGNIVYM